MAALTRGDFHAGVVKSGVAEEGAAVRTADGVMKMPGGARKT
jgi:hypothetical protein